MRSKLFGLFFFWFCLPIRLSFVQGHSIEIEMNQIDYRSFCDKTMFQFSLKTKEERAEKKITELNQFYRLNDLTKSSKRFKFRFTRVRKIDVVKNTKWMQRFGAIVIAKRETIHNLRKSNVICRLIELLWTLRFVCTVSEQFHWHKTTLQLFLTSTIKRQWILFRLRSIIFLAFNRIVFNFTIDKSRKI